MTETLIRIDGQSGGQWTHGRTRLRLVCRSGVHCCQLSKDSDILFVSDKTGNIFVFHFSRKKWRKVSRFSSPVTCLLFAEGEGEREEGMEANLIVSTINGNSIHFLKFTRETLSARVIMSVESVHEKSVQRMSCSGDRVMTSSQYDKCLLWSLTSLRVVKQSVDEKCAQTIFITDDVILSDCRRPTRVHLIDGQTFESLETMKDKLFVSKHENAFFTRSSVNIIEKHVIDSERRVQSREVESRDIKDVIFTEKDKRKLILSQNGELREENTRLVCDTCFTRVIAGKGTLLVGVALDASLLVFKWKQKSKVGKPEVKIPEIRELSRELLRKFRKFPEKYRFFIWTQLMRLPLNRKSLATISTADGLYRSERGELLEKKWRNHLETTIAQLLLFRPELHSQSRDLELFSFPFIRLLSSNPLLRFELLATLLDNGFFLDQLLRATQVFQLIHGLVKREAPALFRHMTSLQLGSRDYCQWPIVSVYSELFSRDQCLAIWDNLFLFGPQLNIYLLTAFVVISQKLIQRLDTKDAIIRFFRSQHALPADRVIRLSHALSNKYVSIEPFEYRALSSQLYY